MWAQIRKYYAATGCFCSYHESHHIAKVKVNLQIAKIIKEYLLQSEVLLLKSVRLLLLRHVKTSENSAPRDSPCLGS